jgi:hypothetical protein
MRLIIEKILSSKNYGRIYLTYVYRIVYRGDVMDIKEVLLEAQRAVDEAKVSEDLRQIAFGKAVEILSGAQAKSATAEQGAGKSLLAAMHGSAEGSPVDKIVRKTGLAEHAVGEIYSNGADGGLDVVVGVGKLDSATAVATTQLALLVAGGRQLAELEDWTKSKTIRDTCDYFGRFDNSNFSKTIKRMDDAFSFRGKAQQLEVRVHQRGIEKLKQMIGNLTNA